MQFLLTEQEYEKLLIAQEAAHEQVKHTLQDLCTRVANHEPVDWGWGEPGENVRPWGCVLTAEGEWYCDQCPVDDVCPYEGKHWSK